MIRQMLFALLMFCVSIGTTSAQTTVLHPRSIQERVRPEGWSKEQSTLAEHSTAYRRFDPWGNICGVSLFSDGSGVTLRAYDVNMPSGKVLHSVDIRKVGNKIARTDSWFDSTFTKEAVPAGDIFLEDCEWMLPSLPSEIRPLFHEVYTPRLLNPHTTNKWTQVGDDKNFDMSAFTSLYQNGICSVGVSKDGKTYLYARDSSYHGRELMQTVVAPKKAQNEGEGSPEKDWFLSSHASPNYNGVGEARLVSGPDLFLTYCARVVKYLPEAVRRSIPQRYVNIF